jgi:hypothetical protein
MSDKGFFTAQPPRLVKGLAVRGLIRGVFSRGGAFLHSTEILPKTLAGEGGDTIRAIQQSGYSPPVSAVTKGLADPVTIGACQD